MIVGKPASCLELPAKRAVRAICTWCLEALTAVAQRISAAPSSRHDSGRKLEWTRIAPVKPTTTEIVR